MQSTLRVDDELYRRAKSQAALEGKTMQKFLEESLRLKLNAKRPKRTKKIELSVHKCELNDRVALSPAKIKDMLWVMDSKGWEEWYFLTPTS